MNYQISRNGQMYGPYTLEDLQRYLASGNVLPTDLAKSEAMAEWVPVSELLARTGAAPSAETPAAGAAYAAAPDSGYSAPVNSSSGYAPVDFSGGPAYGGPQAGAIAASSYPDAPNLHWGLVLLFDVLTCGLFMFIWNLVIASWLKRVQPNATSLFFYAGAAALYFVQIVAAVSTMPHHHDFSSGAHLYTGSSWAGLLWALRWIVRLVARYSQRASLEEHFNGPEPIGLRLDAVMTFFFGGLYFQSKINDLNAMKQAARYGAVRQF